MGGEKFVTLTDAQPKMVINPFQVETCSLRGNIKIKAQSYTLQSLQDFKNLLSKLWFSR